VTGERATRRRREPPPSRHAPRSGWAVDRATREGRDAPRFSPRSPARFGLLAPRLPPPDSTLAPPEGGEAAVGEIPPRCHPGYLDRTALCPPGGRQGGRRHDSPQVSSRPGWLASSRPGYLPPSARSPPRREVRQPSKRFPPGVAQVTSIGQRSAPPEGDRAAVVTIPPRSRVVRVGFLAPRLPPSVSASPGAVGEIPPRCRPGYLPPSARSPPPPEGGRSSRRRDSPQESSRPGDGRTGYSEGA